MRLCRDVEAWCAGAAEEFGDPSVPVCQLFLRWRDDLRALIDQYHREVIKKEACADELACGMINGELVFWLGPMLPVFPMPVRMGAPAIADGELEAYGLDLIGGSVWAMQPSLNAAGEIHAFVVLYGVPDPAPWERRIVLP